LDATTIGSLLVGVGAVVGGLVAYLGKRGENALTGYSNLTNDLQEERAELKAERAQLKAERAELAAQHAAAQAQFAAQRSADQAEIARLSALVIQLGGQP
jgi:septal ring factor EnvC (AmiA/AmiB activator)